MKVFLRLWVVVVLHAIVLGGGLLMYPQANAAVVDAAKKKTPKPQPTAGCVPSNQIPPKCPTFTPTPTNTPTSTPTNTPTDTPTATPTNTPTDTPTATPTATP